MPTFRIVWLEERPPGDLELARSLLPDGFTIEMASASKSGAASAEAGALLSQANALLVQHSAVSEQVLAQAPQVRLVQLYGVRDEAIDRAAAQRREITVAVMPLRGCIAVAELGMTFVLALSKQLLKAQQVTATGAYRTLGLTPMSTNQSRHAFQWMKLDGLFEVNGRTLGIIGLGEIGTEVAKRATAFGMEVLYNKRTRLPERAERGLSVEWAELGRLLAVSDFVMLALPYSDAVHHLIGERELSLMRATAFLVNIARGPLVDEAALAWALANGQIAGAGLDVFTEEPLPFDSDLVKSPRVILTPHIGGGTGGAREKQLSDVLRNIVEFAGTGEARYSSSSP
jgi:phosphoglycerate dehydrogenase-like enzyme